jgi:hypothetical protein
MRNLLRSTSASSFLPLWFGPLSIYYNKRTLAVIKVVNLDLLLLLLMVFLLLLLLPRFHLDPIQFLEPTLNKHHFLLFQVATNCTRQRAV